MKNLILCLFILSATSGFTQTEEYQQQLLGTWLATESEEGIQFKKADAFKEENYAMTFFEDGSLMRRSAKGMFEVIWFDHPGEWHFDGDTLVLNYFFDENQKAREKVMITQLNNHFLQFERLDWVEIRE